MSTSLPDTVLSKKNEVMFKVEYEPQTFHSVSERTNIDSMGLINYFVYIIDFSKSVFVMKSMQIRK